MSRPLEVAAANLEALLAEGRGVAALLTHAKVHGDARTALAGANDWLSQYFKAVIDMKRAASAEYGLDDEAALDWYNENYAHAVDMYGRVYRAVERAARAMAPYELRAASRGLGFLKGAVSTAREHRRRLRRRPDRAQGCAQTARAPRRARGRERRDRSRSGSSRDGPSGDDPEPADASRRGGLPTDDDLDGAGA